MITDWIIAVLTLIIALFTYLVWRVYERIAWLTGAMESHSNLMLRIEALRGINGKPLELIWWDPTIGPIPSVKEHGKPVDVTRIYIYLPPALRSRQPTWQERICALFRLP